MSISEDKAEPPLKTKLRRPPAPPGVYLLAFAVFFPLSACRDLFRRRRVFTLRLRTGHRRLQPADVRPNLPKRLFRNTLDAEMGLDRNRRIPFCSVRLAIHALPL